MLFIRRIVDYFFGPCTCEKPGDFLDRWEAQTGERLSSMNHPIVMRAWEEVPYCLRYRCKGNMGRAFIVCPK